MLKVKTVSVCVFGLSEQSKVHGEDGEGFQLLLLRLDHPVKRAGSAYH